MDAVPNVNSGIFTSQHSAVHTEGGWAVTSKHGQAFHTGEGLGLL